MSVMLPRLMGIINVTPDSFSDGGRFLTAEAAIAQGRRLLDEGATILDVGGESTRPGSLPLDVAVEIERILPVIEGLLPFAAAKGAQLSIDTRNAATMEVAIDAGAEIVNDISALTHDPRSRSLVRDSGREIILMHMQGTPETMQQAPAYQNVVQDVHDWLKARVEQAVRSGIARERIMIDPGIGFGKDVQHNLNLLQNLSRFRQLGCRLVLGVSRKGFIGTLSANEPAEDRLGGSITANLYGWLQGADILRVHDVGQMAQALRLWHALTAIPDDHRG